MCILSRWSRVKGENLCRVSPLGNGRNFGALRGGRRGAVEVIVKGFLGAVRGSSWSEDSGG